MSKDNEGGIRRLEQKHVEMYGNVMNGDVSAPTRALKLLYPVHSVYRSPQLA